MTWTIIIVLIVIGLLFLILEILVLPGTNIAGVLGFILLGIGIWQAYSTYGRLAGHYTLGATFLFTFVTLYFSLKSKTWKKLMLKSKIDSKVNIIDEKKVKVGDTGVTVSRLAPAGKATINGEFYEVHSTGDFIDQETEIIVLKINYNKIIVKPKI
ncbi:MAG: NfeD family protein [Bacteroidales bacterium]|nr:NfeD family protein [Bacteroidales bacterium]